MSGGRRAIVVVAAVRPSSPLRRARRRGAATAASTRRGERAIDVLVERAQPDERRGGADAHDQQRRPARA